MTKKKTPQELADGNVADGKAALADLSTDELNQLRAVETGGENRTTFVSAIDEELAGRDGGRSARMATMTPKPRKAGGQLETVSGEG